jgi:hypothetical protein
MGKSRRTIAQNALFHAICSACAKQRQWAGMWLDTIAYKRLFLDAWARHEHLTQGRIVPSLDGLSIVNLGIQSRRLTVDQMADLIEFAQVYCHDNNIPIDSPKALD